MYKCKECNSKFISPINLHTSYESYYGVTSMFDNKTPLVLDLCPYCDSENIEECEEEEYGK